MIKSKKPSKFNKLHRCGLFGHNLHQNTADISNSLHHNPSSGKRRFPQGCTFHTTQQDKQSPFFWIKCLQFPQSVHHGHFGYFFSSAFDRYYLSPASLPKKTQMIRSYTKTLLTFTILSVSGSAFARDGFGRAAGYIRMAGKNNNFGSDSNANLVNIMVISVISLLTTLALVMYLRQRNQQKPKR